MASKWDPKFPAIIDDLKTMTLTSVERKHGLPLNTLSGIIKDWQKKGKLPADYEPAGKAIHKARFSNRVTKSKAQKAEKLEPNTQLVQEVRNLTDKLEDCIKRMKSMPAMPAFNEAWGDAVKVEWLKTLAVIGKI